eukprot:PhF_6_TR27892/c0_g1_i2/m.40863
MQDPVLGNFSFSSIPFADDSSLNQTGAMGDTMTHSIAERFLKQRAALEGSNMADHTHRRLEDVGRLESSLLHSRGSMELPSNFLQNEAYVSLLKLCENSLVRELKIAVKRNVKKCSDTHAKLGKWLQTTDMDETKFQTIDRNMWSMLSKEVKEMKDLDKLNSAWFRKHDDGRPMDMEVFLHDSVTRARNWCLMRQNANAVCTALEQLFATKCSLSEVDRFHISAITYLLHSPGIEDEKVHSMLEKFMKKHRHKYPVPVINGSDAVELARQFLEYVVEESDDGEDYWKQLANPAEPKSPTGVQATVKGYRFIAKSRLADAAESLAESGQTLSASSNQIVTGDKKVAVVVDQSLLSARRDALLFTMASCQSESATPIEDATNMLIHFEKTTKASSEFEMLKDQSQGADEEELSYEMKKARQNYLHHYCEKFMGEYKNDPPPKVEGAEIELGSVNMEAISQAADEAVVRLKEFSAHQDALDTLSMLSEGPIQSKEDFEEKAKEVIGLTIAHKMKHEADEDQLMKFTEIEQTVPLPEIAGLEGKSQEEKAVLVSNELQKFAEDVALAVATPSPTGVESNVSLHSDPVKISRRRESLSKAKQMVKRRVQKLKARRAAQVAKHMDISLEEEAPLVEQVHTRAVILAGKVQETSGEAVQFVRQFEKDNPELAMSVRSTKPQQQDRTEEEEIEYEQRKALERYMERFAVYCEDASLRVDETMSPIVLVVNPGAVARGEEEYEKCSQSLSLEEIENAIVSTVAAEHVHDTTTLLSKQEVPQRPPASEEEAVRRIVEKAIDTVQIQNEVFQKCVSEIQANGETGDDIVTPPDMNLNVLVHASEMKRRDGEDVAAWKKRVQRTVAKLTYKALAQSLGTEQVADRDSPDAGLGGSFSGSVNGTFSGTLSGNGGEERDRALQLAKEARERNQVLHQEFIEKMKAASVPQIMRKATATTTSPGENNVSPTVLSQSRGWSNGVNSNSNNNSGGGGGISTGGMGDAERERLALAQAVADVISPSNNFQQQLPPNSVKSDGLAQIPVRLDLSAETAMAFSPPPNRSLGSLGAGGGVGVSGFNSESPSRAGTLRMGSQSPPRDMEYIPTTFLLQQQTLMEQIAEQQEMLRTLLNQQQAIHNQLSPPRERIRSEIPSPPPIAQLAFGGSSLVAEVDRKRAVSITKANNTDPLGAAIAILTGKTPPASTERSSVQMPEFEEREILPQPSPPSREISNSLPPPAPEAHSEDEGDVESEATSPPTTPPPEEEEPRPMVYAAERNLRTPSFQLDQGPVMEYPEHVEALTSAADAFYDKVSESSSVTEPPLLPSLDDEEVSSSVLNRLCGDLEGLRQRLLTMTHVLHGLPQGPVPISRRVSLGPSMTPSQRALTPGVENLGDEQASGETITFKGVNPPPPPIVVQPPPPPPRPRLAYYLDLLPKSQRNLHIEGLPRLRTPIQRNLMTPMYPQDGQ